MAASLAQWDIKCISFNMNNQRNGQVIPVKLYNMYTVGG